FFRAEDGIRDRNVTGVQTCALPISMTLSSQLEAVARTRSRGNSEMRSAQVVARVRVPGGGRIANAARVVRVSGAHSPAARRAFRSEERRVGKEGRARCRPDP